ncbi:nitrate/nitrite transporter NrtS [Aromatoleum toluclasticum]|uniref:nitrate/nitrite transporter NrtS n=1 Tax=Aromatoleum toluclasticum TaxID=92003 RepID=UPI001D182B99|nr:nitrate/nitrite transporter NrtS [Aromatoleum toluclasticum]MCC4116265.1 nitrate/nitrite transporter NrtS [Aromatoleum toluclasticum]
MTRLVTLLRTACRREIAGAALKVSLVVGVVLNLVNQGGALLDNGPIDWARGLLNFLVPYCVSSYSAALDATRKCRENTR